MVNAVGALKRLSVAAVRPKQARTKTAPMPDCRQSRLPSVAAVKGNFRRIRGSMPTLFFARGSVAQEEKAREASRQGLSISAPYESHAPGTMSWSEAALAGPRMSTFDVGPALPRNRSMPRTDDSHSPPGSDTPLPDRYVGPGFTNAPTIKQSGPPSPTPRVSRHPSQGSMAITPMPALSTETTAGRPQQSPLDVLPPGQCPPQPSLGEGPSSLHLPPPAHWPLPETEMGAPF